MKLGIILGLLTLSCIDVMSIPLVMIVHGTWSARCDWAFPSGDFFEVLASKLAPKNGVVVSFRWSGDNSYQARKRAGEELAHMIESYPASYEIYMIGHSHGGNVALKAGQELAKRNSLHKITALYLLGTPLDNDEYWVATTHMTAVYSIFSYSDFVQPVTGFFQRELPELSNCYNVSITLNNCEPNHTQLRDPLIATWLYETHEIIQKTYANPYKPALHLALYNDKLPEVTVETEREKLRSEDAILVQEYTNSFIDYISHQCF